MLLFLLMLVCCMFHCYIRWNTIKMRERTIKNVFKGIHYVQVVHNHIYCVETYTIFFLVLLLLFILIWCMCDIFIYNTVYSIYTIHKTQAYSLVRVLWSIMLCLHAPHNSIAVSLNAIRQITIVKNVMLEI